MKLWKGILPALLLATMIAVMPAAAADDPLSVVEALDATLNAQNVDGALALFADDATVRQSPPPPGSTGVYEGKAAVRTFLASDVAQHIHFDLAAPRQVAGERVTWINNTSIDPWRNLSIAPLQGKGDATVHGGKIVSLTITLTPDSMATLQRAMAAATPSGLPRTGGGGEASFIRRLRVAAFRVCRERSHAQRGKARLLETRCGTSTPFSPRSVHYPTRSIMARLLLKRHSGWYRQ